MRRREQALGQCEAVQCMTSIAVTSKNLSNCQRFYHFPSLRASPRTFIWPQILDMCRVFSKVLEFARLVSDGVSQGRDGGGQQDPVAAMLEAAQGRAPGGPPPGQQASGCVAQTYQW